MTPDEKACLDAYLQLQRNLREYKEAKSWMLKA